MNQTSPQSPVDRKPESNGASLANRPFDPAAEPIWDAFDRLLSEVPAEELSRLPSDAAEQHDHYIYGLPKRTP